MHFKDFDSVTNSKTDNLKVKSRELETSVTYVETEIEEERSKSMRRMKVFCIKKNMIDIIIYSSMVLRNLRAKT
jgi:hypothetical protein